MHGVLYMLFCYYFVGSSLLLVWFGLVVANAGAVPSLTVCLKSIEIAKHICATRHDCVFIDVSNVVTFWCFLHFIVFRHYNNSPLIVLTASENIRIIVKREIAKKRLMNRVFGVTFNREERQIFIFFFFAIFLHHNNWSNAIIALYDIKVVSLFPFLSLHHPMW